MFNMQFSAFGGRQEMRKKRWHEAMDAQSPGGNVHACMLDEQRFVGPKLLGF